jgi:hypothetical protein
LIENQSFFRLAKFLQAEEEKEKKELPQKLKEQKEVLYCLDKFDDWLIERPKDWTNKSKSTFSHQTPFTSAFVKGIFRPPKFVTV